MSTVTSSRWRRPPLSDDGVWQSSTSTYQSTGIACFRDLLDGNISTPTVPLALDKLMLRQSSLMLRQSSAQRTLPPSSEFDGELRGIDGSWLYLKRRRRPLASTNEAPDSSLLVSSNSVIAPSVSPAPSVASLVSVGSDGLVSCPGSPTFEQQIDQLGSGLFMITGAGSKRSAPHEVAPSEDLASSRQALHAAVEALVCDHSADELTTALTALGPHVNIRRMEANGCTALHAALARHAFPQRYPRLADAVNYICKGKHLRTAETHAAQLVRLVRRLGGPQVMADIVAECSAAASTPPEASFESAAVGLSFAEIGGSSSAVQGLMLLRNSQTGGDDNITPPCVTAIVGATGNADKPVVLRLGLPVMGLLALPGPVSPPLSPPASHGLSCEAGGLTRMECNSTELPLSLLADELCSELGPRLLLSDDTSGPHDPGLASDADTSMWLSQLMDVEDMASAGASSFLEGDELLTCLDTFFGSELFAQSRKRSRTGQDSYTTMGSSPMPIRMCSP